MLIEFEWYERLSDPAHMFQVEMAAVPEYGQGLFLHKSLFPDAYDSTLLEDFACDIGEEYDDYVNIKADHIRHRLTPDGHVIRILFKFVE